MRGPASTSFGGIVPVHKRYGYGQRVFRYYRIEFPDTERGINSYPFSKTVYYSNTPTQYLAHIYFQGELEGSNLLLNTDVTLSSSTLDDADLTSLISSIRMDGSGFIVPGYTMDLRTGQNTDIVFDFKKATYISDLSLCLENMRCGWRLYGSHDSVSWSLINDVTPEYLATRYPRIISGFRWFSINLDTNKQRPEPTEPKFNYWGVCYGITGAGNYGGWYNIYIHQIQFLDGAGGTNLCTGGDIEQWMTCSNLVLNNEFDGDLLNTYSTNMAAKGSCYHFPTPVNPPVVAITSGGVQSGLMREFIVLKSNDGVNWYYVKYVSTPDGTWPSKTTVEFTL